MSTELKEKKKKKFLFWPEIATVAESEHDGEVDVQDVVSELRDRAQALVTEVEIIEKNRAEDGYVYDWWAKKALARAIVDAGLLLQAYAGNTAQEVLVEVLDERKKRPEDRYGC